MPDSSIQSALQTALRLRGEKRLGEARAICGEILLTNPNQGDALHLNGVLIWEMGNPGEALDWVRRATAGSPERWDFYNTLGLLLSVLGQKAEAIEAFGRAVSSRGNQPAADLVFNLANALQAGGKTREAIEEYRRAIAVRPEFLGAVVNLGNALQESGQLQEAIGAFRQATKVATDSVDAWFNLGNALGAAGEREEAIGAFRRAIEIQPNHVSAHLNLASALRENLRFVEAIEEYRRAIAMGPESGAAYVNLGLTLRANRQPAEAVEAFVKAMELNPGDANARHLLAGALRAVGRYEEAIPAYQRAVELDPELAEAYLNMGSALMDIGEIDAALGAFDRYIALRPDSAGAASHRLYVLHLQPDFDPEKVFAEHLEWSRRFAVPRQREGRRFDSNRDPDRVLRVGYLSPDLHDHSVAFFLENLLAGHDRSQVEIVCYADSGKKDRVTDRLRKLSAQWRDVEGMEDDRLEETIRGDAIDILVDLTGHTPGNRLPLFARRLAPIQATYLGYPDTTGVSEVDFRLTDAFADPPGGTERWNTEELVRLPGAFLCMGKMESAPDVAPAPAVEAGYVTFGSFNGLAKVNDRILELWARILGEVPGSRLLIKSTGLEDERPRRRVMKAFISAGIDPGRIELRGKTAEKQSHLDLYRRVDIGLDTFPYHGTTITCEALWMGVPVVTLEGKAHVSRVGVSLLSNAGLGELVARTDEEYVGIAAELARDVGRMARIRAGLRARLGESVLTRPREFARNVELAYREMWRRRVK